MPVPADPPAWLMAARYACLGLPENGLPAAYGWMLLVLAPASFLVAILVLWGPELPGSLRRAGRSVPGRGVFALIALVAIVEGGWVFRKIETARAVTAWSAAQAVEVALPAEYPRNATVAPDFRLVDQHGGEVSPGSFKGQPVVLTFVFAHCETLCPLIVETIKQVTPGAVLLITLDPWRDTPSALPAIAARWALPENFHVLSSRRADEVVGAIQAYEAPVERSEKSGDIVHPALVFLIDAEGRLAYTFNNPSAAWIREGLARLGRTTASAG